MMAPIFKITIAKEDAKAAEKLAYKLSNLKNKPDGTYELIWSIPRYGYAESYNNDRIMWLGWQLEKAGIDVTWEKC